MAHSNSETVQYLSIEIGGLFYFLDEVDDQFPFAEEIIRLRQDRRQMLEALEAAYDALGGYGHAYQGPEEYDLMDRIKAAIAKAKGRTGDEAG